MISHTVRKKTLAVKFLVNLANHKQFAKVFAKISLSLVNCHVPRVCVTMLFKVGEAASSSMIC